MTADAIDFLTARILVLCCVVLALAILFWPGGD